MTGGDIPIGDFTHPVTADLSSNQFYAVYLNSTTLALATSGSQKVLGILQDNPNGATKATVGAVRELGHSKCWVTSAAVAAGDALKVSGTAGMLTVSSSASDVVVAIAMEGNGSASCIIEIALTNRVAEGGYNRSGHLVFTVPMVTLGTAGGAVNAIAAAPLGFTGRITDCFVIPTTVASSSGATSISLTITATPVTGLAVACSNAALKTRMTPITSTGTAGANTFVSTDTLTIVSTSSVTFATDSGVAEIHVITN